MKNLIVLALIILVTQSAQAQLLDKKATKETKNLYANLQALRGKSVLFGHQDDTAYGIAWWAEKNQSDIKKVSGNYPAVYGWDLGHLELGDTANIDQVSFNLMRQLMQQAYHRGGINTVSWHLKNPLTGGSSWDVTSNKVVQSILPKGEKHSLYIEWLNKLADFVKSVKTDEGKLIPILFRPFHEHTGSWFWWGKNLCTKDEYTALWQFTVNYLKDTKDVHNLIYIYSPDYVADQQNYFERYPSDAYVDVLGLDLYHRNGEEQAAAYIERVQNVMQFLDNYTQKSKKPYVFSETGLNELGMSNWFTDVLAKAIEPYKPAYVLLWRNAYNIPGHYFAPYPGHPSADDFVKFIKLPSIMLEHKMPAMYK